MPGCTVVMTLRVPISYVTERIGFSSGLMPMTVSCPNVPAGSVSLPAGASTPAPTLA